MAAKSDEQRYGTVAVIIHWSSAVLIAVLLVSGLRAANADPESKLAILRFHIPMGLTVLLLTLFRVAWWWRFDHKPRALAGTEPWQDFGAKAVHGFVYVLVLGIAAAGVVMMALSGAGRIVLLGAAGALPDFLQYAAKFPHGLGGRLLMALLAIHILAALYHQLIRRDGIVSRMWFARTAE